MQADAAKGMAGVMAGTTAVVMLRPIAASVAAANVAAAMVTVAAVTVAAVAVVRPKAY